MIQGREPKTAVFIPESPRYLQAGQKSSAAAVMQVHQGRARELTKTNRTVIGDRIVVMLIMKRVQRSMIHHPRGQRTNGRLRRRFPPRHPPLTQANKVG